MSNKGINATVIMNELQLADETILDQVIKQLEQIPIANGSIELDFICISLGSRLQYLTEI